MKAYLVLKARTAAFIAIFPGTQIATRIDNTAVAQMPDGSTQAQSDSKDTLDVTLVDVERDGQIATVPVAQDRQFNEVTGEWVPRPLNGATEKLLAIALANYAASGVSDPIGQPNIPAESRWPVRAAE